MTGDIFDAIIVGGSYAGLSAALSLGRALRSVLIIDSGNPCNKQAPHLQNLLNHDGERPEVIAELAKEQVLRYSSVRFYRGVVIAVERQQNHFGVRISDSQTFRAKKILFATGLQDLFPEITGFQACWGKSLLHCPYCHGYEFRDHKTGLLEYGDMTFGHVKLVSQWSKDLTIFTQGKNVLNATELAAVNARNIRVIDEPIVAIKHESGYMTGVELSNREVISLTALYATPPHQQQCDIPVRMGCTTNKEGMIEANVLQQTCVPGVYVAGDNSSHGRALAVAIAAGAVAGMYINDEITDDEFDMV